MHVMCSRDETYTGRAIQVLVDNMMSPRQGSWNRIRQAEKPILLLQPRRWQARLGCPSLLLQPQSLWNCLWGGVLQEYGTSLQRRASARPASSSLMSWTLSVSPLLPFLDNRRLIMLLRSAGYIHGALSE